MTRILGIDPGSRTTGFGVIDVDRGKVRYVASGCVRVKGEDLGERLKVIFEGVRDVTAIYEPTEMAIEKVFVQRNVDSALKLGQARGAAICATVNAALPVHEYSPNQIKQALVGRGHADKAQIQHMVSVILGLDGTPQSDAADALACAVCHSHFSGTLTRWTARTQG